MGKWLTLVVLALSLLTGAMSLKAISPGSSVLVANTTAQPPSIPWNNTTAQPPSIPWNNTTAQPPSIPWN